MKKTLLFIALSTAYCIAVTESKQAEIVKTAKG